jgi:hypothetical protein
MTQNMVCQKKAWSKNKTNQNAEGLVIFANLYYLTLSGQYLQGNTSVSNVSIVASLRTLFIEESDLFYL